MPGASVKDVNQTEFVKELSAFLKKSGKMKTPDWVDIVKLGRFNELAPYDDDWFYTRSASVMRHLYLRFPTGVGRMKRIYGARKRNGVRPCHRLKGSGSVARKVIQSLEGCKLVERDPSKKGRRLTNQGRRDCDRIATQMKKKIDGKKEGSGPPTSSQAPAATPASTKA